MNEEIKKEAPAQAPVVKKATPKKQTRKSPLSALATAGTGDIAVSQGYVMVNDSVVEDQNSEARAAHRLKLFKDMGYQVTNINTIDTHAVSTFGDADSRAKYARTPTVIIGSTFDKALLAEVKAIFKIHTVI